MNFANENTNANLSVAEIDSLITNLDIDEITEGINRSIEDFKYGRCYDLKTGMDKVKRMLLDE